MYMYETIRINIIDINTCVYIYIYIPNEIDYPNEAFNYSIN